MDEQNTIMPPALSLSFQTLREANMQRALQWSGATNFGVEELLFRSNELGGETGEALNAVKKYVRFLKGWKGGVEEAESVTAIKEELADVVICADRIAEAVGVNLGAAVQEKFNKTSQKYGLTVEISACNPPLWIVGKVFNQGAGSWEFQGVFSTESAAVAACVTGNYFVGPAILDKQLPHETSDWTGAHYPKPADESDASPNRDVTRLDWLEKMRDDCEGGVLSRCFLPSVETLRQRIDAMMLL